MALSISEFLQRYVFSIAPIVLMLFEYLLMATISQAILQTTQIFVALPTENDPSTITECSKNLSTLGYNSETLAALLCIIAKDFFKIILSFVAVVGWIAVMCFYFQWRHQVQIPKLSFKLSKKGMFIAAIILVGFIFNLSIQYSTGHYIHSFDNFKHIKDNKDAVMVEKLNKTIQIGQETFVEEVDNVVPSNQISILPHVDYTKVMMMVFGAPIIEEFILRIILITVITRISKDVIFAIASANIAFSLLHLVNAMMHASGSYVKFQALVAVILGIFYSTRYIVTENLLESIILHVLNNVTAIFLPIYVTWEQLYPFLPISAVSILIYLIFIAQDIPVIRQKFNVKIVKPKTQ